MGDFGQVKHFGKEQVSDFQGPGDSQSLIAPAYDDASHKSAVDARDATLAYLYHAYHRDGTVTAGDRLIQNIQARSEVVDLDAAIGASLSEAFAQVVSDEVEWTDQLLQCHRQAVSAFGASCGWSEERLPLSKTLYKLCARTLGNSEPVAAAIQSI